MVMRVLLSVLGHSFVLDGLEYDSVEPQIIKENFKWDCSRNSNYLNFMSF